jgi:Spy/CpxP family protein refolding chaperone
MKNGVESLGRIRAQGVAILVLTFVVGVLVGFAGERVRGARRAVPPPVPPELGPGVTGRFRQGNLPTMFGELNLTPDQVGQIAAILESGRPRSDAVMLRLRAVTDSIRQEVRGVLTPEQAARWDSLEMHMRRGRMREGMPGRRGGRGDPQPPIP